MPNRKTPYMWQYLFNVQRELGGSMALEVGYLGSRSYRLERMFDWNETIPGVTGSVQSRKPYPEFTKVQEIGNVAEARYNSLAVKLTRRLHDGLSVLGGYTLSKSTDNGSGIRTLNGDTLFPQDSFCLECEWALSIFDVRHRFVSSILYELPFGEGKPYLTDGIGGAILGGWQVSAIISISSGFPRNVIVGTDRSNTGGGQDRPNATGEEVELPSDQRTVAAVVQHECVRHPAGRHLGERRAEHGARTWASPAWMRRSSGTSGSAANTLQFRLEAFNALNHPIWNDPNTALTNPNYGPITSTRKPMRELQLGLKFVF